MSPVGLGNDIGGSLRNPATCCGIASLKPSAGMVPSFMFGPVADGPASFQLMPVEGPMARRVADVRLAFGLLAGRDPRDPYSVPVPVGSPRDEQPAIARRGARESTRGSTDPRVSRIGYEPQPMRWPTRATRSTEDGPPRFEDAAKTWFDFIGEDIRFMGPMITPIMSDTANAFLGALLDSIPPVDLAGYNQILMTRQALMREWGMWFTNTDLVLTPTWTQLPFEHGWDARQRARHDRDDAMRDDRERARAPVGVRARGARRRCAGRRAADRRPIRRRQDAGRRRSRRGRARTAYAD